MIISAPDLKNLLKKVSGAKTEFLTVSSASGELIAFDTEVIVHVLSPKLEEPDGFSVSVNLRKFSQVVNRMSGQITIEKKIGGLVLQSQRATVILDYAPDKCQALKEIPVSRTFPLAEFKAALQFSAPAADSNRAGQFGGVVQLTDKVVATDGKRLYVHILAQDNSNHAGVLLPVSVVAAIQNLDGEILSLGESESQIYLNAGGVSIFATKPIKKYPDWNNFIPQLFAHNFELDAEEFKQSLRLVETAIDNSERAVSLNFIDGNLTIQSVGKGNRATDQIGYTSVSDDPFDELNLSSPKLMVNIDHLLDFLANIQGTVSFKANGPKEPVWLESGVKQALFVTVIVDGK